MRLRDYARGAVVAHADGLSSIGQPGDLIGVEAGATLLIARIETIQMTDVAAHPRYSKSKEVVRTLQAYTIGNVSRSNSRLSFDPDRSVLPALGAQAVGLTSAELAAVLCSGRASEPSERIVIGDAIGAATIPVTVGIDALLTRHTAVLGSSGQGKTHFVASVLQKLLEKGPNARIVIFDIHDEYANAFNSLPGVRLKETVLGQKLNNDPRAHYHIPYYALGLTGLSRLILPSERTQRPALNFAVDKLRYVSGSMGGSKLVGHQQEVLFDDGRPGNANSANAAIQTLKDGTADGASQWPHMSSIGHLAAEWSCLKYDRGNWVRDGWLYNNVQTMLRRISRLIRDEQFRKIINVEPSGFAEAGFIPPLSYEAEAQKLVSDLFGSLGSPTHNDWNVHIVCLKNLTNDLMPYVLGSLLELYAEQLFARGPGQTHPTLLVLEEAQHYLRQIPGDTDTGLHSLAYERLAREGRKFQVSMLISTQRPSEVSPTVLAQCGTWAVFRLTNDRDQSVIASGSEKANRYATTEVPGLARGQMVMFGDALPLATKIAVKALPSEHAPTSSDASFANAWSK